VSVLSEELGALARRAPARPALRAGGVAFTLAELAAAASARADALADAPRVAHVSLDGTDPSGFVVGFFAARALGRVAVARPPGIPEELAARRESAASAARTPSGGATVFYSSGSVGASKAVPLTDENLAASALAFAPWAEIRAGDRVAIGLSPAHVFAFVRGVLNALLAGAEAAFFVPGRDPLGEADALGADVVLLPSALIGAAARRAGRGRGRSQRLRSVRAVLCGGGRLREEDAAAVERIGGPSVRSGYGLTESAGLGARQRCDRPRRPDSSGSVAPGLDVSIVAVHGAPAGVGEPGEIRMRGPAVFGGYLSPDDPSPSPSPFDAEGRLCTGDVGVLGMDGELSVRGRLAYSLTSGGRVLCAEEVEAALEEHPGVVRAAAAPVGRAFGVLVVAREGSPGLIAGIRRHAARRLPAHARPRRVLCVDELPLTAAGKVDRVEAARRLGDLLPPS